MAISSVGTGAVGGSPAVEGYVDEVTAETPAVDTTPAAESPFAASSFETATANPIVLPMAFDRADASDSDVQGRINLQKKGNGDDSIGGGGTQGISRPADELSLAGNLSGGDISAAIADLPDATKAQVDALLNNADPAIASDAAYALGTRNFANLPADQREKFVDLMATTGKDGVALLAKACEVPTDLSSLRASDGSTVFDNLDRMAKTPGLAEYVPDVLADMLNPGHIWQGNAPTCTSSTMQYELALHNPSEYSRLIAGLAIDGKVTMAGGGVLETQPGAAFAGSVAANDARSPTEAVFQAALMEFANGSDTYDYNKMISVGSGRTYRGLNGEQIQTALDQLFNQSYRTTQIATNDEAAAILGSLNRSNVPNRPVLVDLVVDDHTNHCVSFEGCANGQVTLRDPQTGRQYSVSQQEFIETLAAVHQVPVPRVLPAYKRDQVGANIMVA